ncbi:Membrane protein YidC 1 [Listeria grayi]|uniref:Membrane protein insertase YidC n=3 Tax=Listeria grayi TaxID=1641 RepID=D7UZZ3_LISGR|nr:membrane protein insertase YidC [Listeria grayi]EFI83746.1 membrane protein insertase, YidC/Oxa1 family [Listeria grayi DSM 20601]EUJ30026.1 OxaA-like protein precursor [Listeria grayi FSL F6-1183]MBC1920551.1 membrane protein insertase YidC [Listeria grayi]STY43158.1 Membrane protein YidC 1 [Listeria grayi]VEI33937.1 Membrane protein YidC 1 [Listeria grayi]
MKKKYVILMLVALGALLVLSGCSLDPSQNQDGFFNVYLIKPFASVIKFFASFFDGSYGIAIIITTIIIRAIIMPLNLRTAKAQMGMQTKMAAAKPEIDDIQARVKRAATKEEQVKIQQEMTLVYQKYDINPLQMGCLPLIIQMPILMAFYYAIRGSQEIATHTFLWFNLGHPDMVLAILAGLVYLLQYFVSMIGNTPEQKKQMRVMGLISPAMILFISFSAPSALALYWAVGGLFLAGQTLLTKKLYMNKHPEIKEIEKEEQEIQDMLDKNKEK